MRRVSARPVIPLRADMNDAKKMFDITVNKVFTGAAGLPGGAMAAFNAYKVVRAAATAATGWHAVSLL